MYKGDLEESFKQTHYDDVSQQPLVGEAVGG